MMLRIKCEYRLRSVIKKSLLDTFFECCKNAENGNHYFSAFKVVHCGSKTELSQKVSLLLVPFSLDLFARDF